MRQGGTIKSNYAEDWGRFAAGRGLRPIAGQEIAACTYATQAPASRRAPAAVANQSSSE